MLQSVKCLLCDHEDLSLDPCRLCKKVDVAALVYNSRTEEAKQADFSGA